MKLLIVVEHKSGATDTVEREITNSTVIPKVGDFITIDDYIDAEVTSIINHYYKDEYDESYDFIEVVTCCDD